VFSGEGADAGTRRAAQPPRPKPLNSRTLVNDIPAMVVVISVFIVKKHPDESSTIGGPPCAARRRSAGRHLRKRIGYDPSSY
jgi:hypothetical protein